MKLLTKANRKSLPALYSTESTELKDKTIRVKFFTPWTNWTWYAVEFDGEDRFFGLVMGQENEWGYFSLRELETTKGRFGLSIERDRHFPPQTVQNLIDRKQIPESVAA
mgnify:CR=1 FL=1|jgi:hypothetical protein|tara:strand:- start:451 stop:777 length:327 start_codon:yes stop_codon:yes gene_type:complete